MYNYKEEKGITLVILIAIVMVLLIIAGVGVSSGLNIMKKASIESLKTNMLLLQAKGKEYVENTNFHFGTGELSEEQKTEIKNQYLKGTLAQGELPEKLKENEEAYQLSSQDMQDMGLNDLVETAKDYLMIYNIQEEYVDIMYKPGLTKDNKTYYTLISIEEAGL